jgi:hypothetical protein
MGADGVSGGTTVAAVITLAGLRSYVRTRPRIAAAFAFGSATMVVTHLAWVPGARMSGLIPALTIAAGAAHGVAGAISGRRLVDYARTPTSRHAGLLGAGTSLLALLLFAPPFALFVSRGFQTTSLGSYLWLTFWTGVFSFLAAGWALLLVSAGVGWGLYRVANPYASDDRQKTT